MIRLAALECAQFPVSPERGVFYAYGSGACGTFPASAANLLNVCAVLATFDEHVARCVKELRIHPAQREATAELLRSLVEAGFFMEEADLLSRLAGASGGVPAARVETLGFVTRGRPELLERAVTSFCENAATFGRKPRLMVMCDGDDADFAAAERTLAKARAAFGIEGTVLGAATRRALVQALVARGLPEDVLRFGLERDPGTYAVGAARNTLLACAWGAPMVYLDDDIVCRTATFETAREPALLDTADPTQFRFFRDRAAALAESRFVELDFLAAYERFLGRSPSSKPTARFERVPSALLGAMARGRPTTVMCTAGIVGDSGMGTPYYLYTREGVTRERLWAGGDEYRALLLSREVARFVERPTIVPVGVCMGGVLGVDARQLLPPFAPLHRNEDGFFGTMLRLSRPDAFTAFLPFTVVHDPSDSRAFTLEDMWKGAAGVRPNDAVMALLATLPPQLAGLDQAAAMRAIGVQVSAAASSSDASFVECLRIAWLRQKAPFVKNLRRIAAASAAAPPLFRQDLAALGTAMERALVDGGVPDGEGTLEDRTRRAKGYTRMIGELLQIWPDVLTESRAFSERVRRIAVAVA